VKKLLLLILALTLLSGCNTESPNSNIDSGTYTPIKITTENGKEVLTSSLDSAQKGNQSSNAGDIGKQFTNTALSKVRAKLSSIRAREIYSSTSVLPGSCGGTETLNAKIDVETNEFTIDIDYKAYCDAETEETLNGRLSATGEFTLFNGEVTFKLSLDNFRLISTINNEDLSMSGTAITSMQFDTMSVNMTLNFTIKDFVTNKDIILENFVFSSVDIHDDSLTYLYTQEEMNGRVYQSDIGYIDITTTTPFKVKYDNNPHEGSLIMKGADDSQLALIAIDDTQYQLNIDEDGDGTPEEMETNAWDNLELGLF